MTAGLHPAPRSSAPVLRPAPSLAHPAGLWLLSLLLLACNQEGRYTAQVRLQRGIEALQAGQYAAAARSCNEAARGLPADQTPLVCSLVASLHARNFSEALPPAQQLAASNPDKPWYEAVRMELHHRLGLTSDILDSPPASPETAWACADAPCRIGPDAPLPPALPPLRQALLRFRHGQPATAIATLLQAPSGPDRNDLLLLLLLRSRDTTPLLQLLDRTACRTAAPPCETPAALAFFLRREAALLQPGSLPPAPQDPPSRLEPLLAPLAEREPGPPRLARDLARAAASLPDSAVAHLDAGIAALRTGAMADAAFFLERAAQLAADPTWPGILLYLAALMDDDDELARTRLAALAPALTPAWTRWLASLQR